MHLGILDILDGELPEELKSAFDVVHLRAFAVVIKGGDPTGVLDRLIEMLSKLDRPLLIFYLLHCILSDFSSSLFFDLRSCLSRKMLLPLSF